MKIKNIIFLLFISLGSCNYLDIVPDNVATIDYAFRNRASAEKYLFTCYGYRPEIGGVSNDPAMNGSDESCQRYSIQNMWPNFPNSRIARGEQSATDPILNYWDGNRSLWTGIRDCNIFLEGIGGVIDLTDAERKRWIAEVKFLKAYYHYYLMRCYGPIPIVDVNLPIDVASAEMKSHREPIDKVVTYIADLMKEAASELPPAIEIIEGTEAGRVYDLVALSMRAQVLLYAASPLFNGNTDFASMIDNRGISLFNQTYDAAKWKVAADACKEAIDACHAQGKALYTQIAPLTTNQDKVFQVQTTYREAICDRWNKELIWGSTNNNVWLLAQYATPRLMRFTDELNEVMSEWAPTINLVDNYYSADGVPISEDIQWQSQGWYENRYKIREKASTGDEKFYVKENEITANLHFNREPRFYASIGFDKGIYYGSGYYEFPANVKHCDFINLQVSGFQGGSGYSATGYAAKKMHSFKNSQTSSDVSPPEYFPFPILRLADLYLMYAEALNEAEGPSTEVFTYLDLIRARVGLKGVKESWSLHSNKPNKPSTKDGLREIIHQERGIELALEGKRFWDIRRWKQINVMNVLPKGWSILGETPEDFYRVSYVYSYYPVFTIKDYFWPIKESNLAVNSNLMQNYGW